VSFHALTWVGLGGPSPPRRRWRDPVGRGWLAVRRRLEGGFELDDDPARVDVAAVHDFLSKQAPWALGWPLAEVVRLVRESQRVVGLYEGERLVGFSRTFSDGHWLTYLADCYVLPEFRGRGLGYELVRETVENGPYRDHQWLLHTADAAGLYEKFGFERRSEFLMERLSERSGLSAIRARRRRTAMSSSH
jgi:ribosomal protein S18 acetylase RimI-like enzyme